MTQTPLVAYLLAILLITLGGSIALSKVSQSRTIPTFEEMK